MRGAEKKTDKLAILNEQFIEANTVYSHGIACKKNQSQTNHFRYDINRWK
jgi:hypothetical protein